MSDGRITLIGNPNCGKTTLFNALTGARQHVGNWPGVTVERKSGHFSHRGRRVEVVDLPGTYTLDGGDDLPLDERVARDYALSAQSGLLVNVVDAANLERHLYLSGQLRDLERPMLVVLNMVDALAERGLELDLPALQQALGCPVYAVCARDGRGLDALRDGLLQALDARQAPAPRPSCGAALEGWLAQRRAAEPGPSRLDWLERLRRGELAADACAGEEADVAIAISRYAAIDALCALVLRRTVSARVGEGLDRVALHRLWGVPFFLLAMYAMFWLAIRLGSSFTEGFDGVAGALFVDGPAYWLGGAGAPDWLITLLAYGLGGGVRTVTSFIPVVGAMFLCLAWLEDSGYMARAAVVVDRLMRTVGLPGKAFVPMLVGFGCNVPAVMGTRTLESPRDRLAAIVMMPFMSCGARLPVYALFAALFFPQSGQNVVFGLYLLGIAVALVTGLVLRKKLLPGEASPLLLELPPYRLPSARSVLLHAWGRLKAFVLRAGRAIVAVVMVLSLLGSLGSDGRLVHDRVDASLLSSVGRVLTPAFAPMGVAHDNWPATVGLFTGLFAKESVVGTLDALYARLARADAAPQDAGFDLGASLGEAWASVPANLAALVGLDGAGDATAAPSLSEGSPAQMVQRFGSAAAALAYLVFVLLYTPCVATLGVIAREAGARLAAGVALWTLAVAWALATLLFQAAQLTVAPLAALPWMGVALIVLALGFAALRLTLPAVDRMAAARCAGCRRGCAC